MSSVLQSTGSETGETLEVQEGVKEFARDIEVLLGYSETPQRYEDISQHFEEDEGYFDEDLSYIGQALKYLEEEGRVKQDVRLDVEEPDIAYVLDNPI